MLAVDALIEPEMRRAVAPLSATAPLLGGMVAYHLGWVDATFQPLRAGSVDNGKRLRPAFSLLCCAAAGGNPLDAAPLAAAIELLHNFTLIHDDIQDRSQLRRHRPTVWALWGKAQAINAGDALFAVAHQALYQLQDRHIPPSMILQIAGTFDAMTGEIVAGQVLDLQFENRNVVTAGEYLQMIEGKTAAVLRFAAESGARIGSAADDVAQLFGAFGLAMGLGFQVRDDYLGAWGTTAQTGKPSADDIRRRKKSLPVVLLRNHLSRPDAVELDQLFALPEVPSAGVKRVLEMLDHHAVRSEVDLIVDRYHAEASRALDAAMTHSPNAYDRQPLDALIKQMATRIA